MDERTCSAAGCDRRHLARGLCSAHYQRMMKGHEVEAEPVYERPTYADECSVDGCARAERTKGLCVAHYARLLTSGNVGAADVKRSRRGIPAIQRLEADTAESADGCLEYVGSISRSTGYGHIFDAGRTWLAHRFMWTHYNGPIPKGMVVRHKCDNRICVRLAHLELGTQADNLRDIKDRGRSDTYRLTESDVVAIRSDPRSDGEVAADYDISARHVRNIRARRSWAGVA